MDDDEGRAQSGAPEAQDASIDEQKTPGDDVAAPEAEDAAVAGDGLSEQTSVTHVEPIVAGAEVTAVSAAEQTAVTQVVPAGGETAVTQVAPTAAAAEPIAVTEVVPAPEPATEAVLVRKHNRLRGALVGVLVVLTCLSLVATGVSWWVHYSIFNTNGYMKLVGPVGKDPEAIRALSDYIAGQVITATDLQQRTATALPENAQFLAGPITGAVSQFIADGTDKVLSTPQAYDLWIKINTVAHDKIVALLRGETTNAYIQGDEVKLDTLPLISQVLVWVDGKLPGGLGTKFSPPVIAPGTPTDQATQQVSAWLGRPLPADFGQITLLQNDSLGAAQQAVRLFDALIGSFFRDDHLHWPYDLALRPPPSHDHRTGHRRRDRPHPYPGDREAGVDRARRQHQRREYGRGAAWGGRCGARAAHQPDHLDRCHRSPRGRGRLVRRTPRPAGGGRERRQARRAVAGRGARRRLAVHRLARAPRPVGAARRLDRRSAAPAVGRVASWWSIVLIVLVVVLYEGAISLLTRQWPFAQRERRATPRLEGIRVQPAPMDRAAAATFAVAAAARRRL